MSPAPQPGGTTGDTGETFRKWMTACIKNADAMVNWVTFYEGTSGTQPVEFAHFVDFGAELARRVNAYILNQRTEVDLVCHSMGGLDAAASIALLDDYDFHYGVPPIRGIHHVITYDTPVRGSVNAGSAFFEAIKKLQGRSQPYIQSQAVAMGLQSTFIGELEEQRDHFLRNVANFWPRGAADHGGLIEVSHDSAAFIDAEHFDPQWRNRYRGYDDFSATDHSGPDGVTRDPRAILEALQILLGDQA